MYIFKKKSPFVPLRSICFVLFCFQYYYNPHTQQYMYWDGENHTYIAAPSDQANSEGAPLSTAPSDSLVTSPGSKEKKDKPKSKTAQQVNVMSRVLIRCKANFKLTFKFSGIKIMCVCNLIVDRWQNVHEKLFKLTH